MVRPLLREQMCGRGESTKRDPSLRVLSSCGYYDLVCSYFANEQVASRLDPALKPRVLVRNYGGAHAVYIDDAVRLALKKDAAGFIQVAVKR